MSVYDDLEIKYYKADDAVNILFTANTSGSLVESTTALNVVQAIPIESHVSSSKWIEDIQNESDAASESGSDFASDDELFSSGDEFSSGDQYRAQAVQYHESLNKVRLDPAKIPASVGLQTYLRSQNWLDDSRYSLVNKIDPFDYFSQCADQNYSDLFFEVFANNQKAKASTNSMSTMTLLNEKELFEETRNLPCSFEDKKQHLLDIYSREFDFWHFQLLEGFNILLYGFGSKKVLMDTFAENQLKNEIKIIIKGFFPALSLKNILQKICKQVFNFDDPPADAIVLCNTIRKLYASKQKSGYPPIYILVYNIDGVGLRKTKSQVILSLLASIPSVYLIASIDHVKSPFLWDYYISGKFNFISHHVCTYDQYFHETRYESNPFMSKASKGVMGIRAAMMVLSGLPKKAHLVFATLARQQIQTSVGVSLKLLARVCREAFIVFEEHSLKGYLGEFKSHRLVKVALKDGVEIYSIPLPTVYINQILSHIEADSTKAT